MRVKWKHKVFNENSNPLINKMDNKQESLHFSKALIDTLKACETNVTSSHCCWLGFECNLS